MLTVWWVICMPADWVPSECQSGAGRQRHVSPKSRVLNTAWTTLNESSVAPMPESYHLTLPATGNQFSSMAADGFLGPWSAKNRCALLEGAVWLQWLSRTASCTQCTLVDYWIWDFAEKCFLSSRFYSLPWWCKYIQTFYILPWWY